MWGNCHHFIRGRALDGVMNPTYAHTSHQLSDLLTKVRIVDQQSKLLVKLGVHSTPPNLRESVEVIGPRST